jgi:hypothetical protein
LCNACPLQKQREALEMLLVELNDEQSRLSRMRGISRTPTFGNLDAFA